MRRLGGDIEYQDRKVWQRLVGEVEDQLEYDKRE